VIATAAVSDWRPDEVAEEKLKKDEAPDAISLARNPDILLEMGKKKGERVLVGFAAETTEVAANARAKLENKNLDLVVANDVSAPGLGFGSDRNAVTFVSAGGEDALEETSKRRLATAVLDRTVELLKDPR
jgi:phosphopantothenoylcysteine decarboxylase/phosphopantothenate--cysteine ligase